MAISNLISCLTAPLEIFLLCGSFWTMTLWNQILSKEGVYSDLCPGESAVDGINTTVSAVNGTPSSGSEQESTFCEGREAVFR